MTDGKTFIGDLDDCSDNSFVLTILDMKNTKNVNEFLLDGTVPLENRIQTLDKYYETCGESQCMEIINRLSTMYIFSGTKMLEKYLFSICINCNLPSVIKLIPAKALCSFNPEKELGYKALNHVCQFMENVATPCQIDAVCLLMRHASFQQNSRDYFCSIINNDRLDCDYRYKTILSLENKEIHNRPYFLHEAVSEFFNNIKNKTSYRILAGQYLIQKCEVTEDERSDVELTLMSFAQDPDLDYNLRADSADVLLKTGSPENKNTAREIIMMLGRHEGNVKTIFDNAQNVHVDEIEKSVLKALEFLAGIEMKKISNDPGAPDITFEYVKKQISDMVEEQEPKEPKEFKAVDTARKKKKRISKKKLEIVKKYEKEKEIFDEKKDKIDVSLNRIYMDRALYSQYNYTLIHILLKIWTYMLSHDSVEEMKKRLLQELIDMSGTCSSGFSSRLVNVISGFGDFNFTISWRDQLVANLAGRLNSRARDIINKDKIEENRKLYGFFPKIDAKTKTQKNIRERLEEFQGQVLEEMMINSNDYASRTNFLLFFRRNMLSIREELYEDFKDHITDDSFDLYFRAAISMYETGGYV